MEPNPYRIDIRRKLAPFHPGDMVRYIGVGSQMPNYNGNRPEGIVQRCWRGSFKWRPETWICSVDWSDPVTKPGFRYVTSRARYMASNLALVRPVPPADRPEPRRWGKPELAPAIAGIRPDDV